MPRDVIVIKCTRQLTLTMLVTHDVPETLIKTLLMTPRKLICNEIGDGNIIYFPFSYFKTSLYDSRKETFQRKINRNFLLF